MYLGIEQLLLYLTYLLYLPYFLFFNTDKILQK